jgi:uncharacterized membrane protein YkvA (DUF1232 family)
LIAKLKDHAASLKREVYALCIAARDPRVPWYAKIIMGVVLAYALSPIDLIPDFIPVLGYLDDLIIVPLGIALALKMIPAQVMLDARLHADDLLRQGKPVSRARAVIVIIIWLAILAIGFWFVLTVVMKKHFLNQW